MSDPPIPAASPLLRGLFRVRSHDNDVVRRARSFITLCVVFAAITALLAIPIAIADPGGDVGMSLFVLAAVVCNYTLGVALARAGWVDVAGFVVSTNLSLSIAAAILLHFRALNDGIWFMALSVIISGLAMRPRGIGAILGLNIGLTTIMLAAVPPDPQGPFYNFGKIMILDALMVTMAIAAVVDATRSRDLFLRQGRAVADLQVASQRAEQANRAKSVFLANMSHELRTPLNAIIGFSEMLQDDAADDGVRADLGKIEAAGKHLLSIISDLLDLSKVEVGKLEIRAGWFDLPAFVAALCELVPPLASGNHNTFNLQNSAAGAMFTDEVRLRQALLNLLGNACKFTQRGTITLSVNERAIGGKPHVEFVVTDTGIGIAREDLERIYQPFVQLDDSSTRRKGGTGLGLTLTREIAVMLGGDVRVESTLGQGSTFTVAIPRRWSPMNPVDQSDVHLLRT